jgi:hypothetical protein
MAHEHGLVMAEMIEEAEQVIGEVPDTVVLNLGENRAVAVAALVWADHMITGVG